MRPVCQHMLMPSERRRSPVPRPQVVDDDLGGLIDWLVDALMAQRPGSPRVKARLLAATWIRDAIEARLEAEIAMARAADGVSWSDIGQAIGVSAQAAHRKYR